jgi:hypothetical protein
MNKQQELAEQIVGILYKNKTDEADEGSWIESKDFYKVAAAIVEAMGVQQEKEQPSLQSGKLSAEEVLYKHVLADADNHVMGTTLTVTVPPLEELKNNQQFQMHVAAMKEYAQQVYATAAPAKEVEAISDSPDWKQLRDKFFKECTETYEAGKGLNVLRKVSYNIAPHDLFEWFKKELQAVEAIDASAKEGMKWVKASERLPDNEGIYKVKRVHSEGIETGEFICGAFTNYYGYRVMEWLDESAPAKEVEAISDSEDYNSGVNTFIGEGLTGWQVGFTIGCQTFYLQPNLVEERGTKEWAEWLERCLKTALHGIKEAAKEAISVPAQQGVSLENILDFTDWAFVQRGRGDARPLKELYENWEALAAQPLQPSLEEKKP